MRPQFLAAERAVTADWRKVRAAATMLVLLCGCASKAPSELPERIRLPDVDSRVEAWREDIDALARELPARHVDAFRVAAEAEWRAAAAALAASVPELTDAEVLLGLARLGAAIGDGHSGFYLTDGRLGFHRHPLWLLQFADGVFVKGVAGGLEEALNGELLAIGGVPVEECLERLRPFVPHDNESGLGLVLPDVLVQGEVLAALGLAPDATSAEFRVRTAQGEERALTSLALAPGSAVTWAVRYDAGAEAPLCERLRGELWASARVADGRALYIAYNRCRDGEDDTFAAWCQRLLAGLDADPPERAVVDLRFNPGGSSAIVEPLVDGLAERFRDGELYVLIGPGTFSSGLWAALDFDREAGAVLVGEPTGGTPNAPGEVGRLVLPRSTLVVRYAKRFWNRGGEAYGGPALEPEIPVAETSTDHFAGRDPALLAALTGL